MEEENRELKKELKELREENKLLNDRIRKLESTPQMLLSTDRTAEAGCVPTSRLTYGVTEEMINLVRIEGIGRKKAISILNACEAQVFESTSSSQRSSRASSPRILFKGKELLKKSEKLSGNNIWWFLRNFHANYGDEETLKLLVSAHGIGDKLAEKVCTSLKSQKA